MAGRVHRLRRKNFVAILLFSFFKFKFKLFISFVLKDEVQTPISYLKLSFCYVIVKTKVYFRFNEKVQTVILTCPFVT